MPQPVGRKKGVRVNAITWAIGGSKNQSWKGGDVGTWAKGNQKKQRTMAGGKKWVNMRVEMFL